MCLFTVICLGMSKILTLKMQFLWNPKKYFFMEFTKFRFQICVGRAKSNYQQMKANGGQNDKKQLHFTKINCWRIHLYTIYFLKLIAKWKKQKRVGRALPEHFYSGSHATSSRKITLRTTIRQLKNYSFLLFNKF